MDQTAKSMSGAGLCLAASLPAAAARWLFSVTTTSAPTSSDKSRLAETRIARHLFAHIRNWLAFIFKRTTSRE
jgi:hypothetical protein